MPQMPGIRRRCEPDSEAVYGGTWLVDDTQILVPLVVPVGQKQSVVISCVVLGGFADRVKNLPETLSVDALPDCGFKPVRGQLYTAEQSGQGELTGHRLMLLRGELVESSSLVRAAKHAIQDPLEPQAAGKVFPAGSPLEGTAGTAA